MYEGKKRSFSQLTIFGRCGSLFFHSTFDKDKDVYLVPGIAPTRVLQLFFNNPGNPYISCDIVADCFVEALSNPRYLKDCGLDRLGKNRMENLADYIDSKKLHSNILMLAENGRFDVIGAITAIHKAMYPADQRTNLFFQVHSFDPALADWSFKKMNPKTHIFLIRDPAENLESLINFAISRPSILQSIKKFYSTILNMAVMCRLPGCLDSVVPVEIERFKTDSCYKAKVEKILGFSSSETSSYYGIDFTGPPSSNTYLAPGFLKQEKKPNVYRVHTSDVQFSTFIFSPIFSYSSYISEPSEKIDINMVFDFEKYFLSHLAPFEHSEFFAIRSEFLFNLKNVVKIPKKMPKFSVQ
jgi:hypothetical protein